MKSLGKINVNDWRNITKNTLIKKNLFEILGEKNSP